MFLCTVHKHSKLGRWESKSSKPRSPPQSERKLLSTLRSKALEVAKLVSWKKGKVEDEEAVWKKTIIMGEKCRPLNFSGQILYDSQGNRVAQLPKKSFRVHSGALVA